MNIELPQKVKMIMNRIQAAGYEAYAVGGCVRDSLLGRTPDDWDITTSAKPTQVKELFRRSIDTGIQHGTVTVMMDKEAYEVTTYRIDGEYEDSRHPKDVEFTSDIAQDLQRRDFTVNAMAYNDKEGLLDLFGGLEDMERMLIRCVGDPRERFGEDALRIMRAVRFSAQLGYSIDGATRTAIQSMAPKLKNISAERIRTELVKLLISEHPERLKTCYETGITAVVLPEFDRLMQTEQNNPHHCYCVGEHTLYSLKEVKDEKILRLSMLFHDMGKPDTKSTDKQGTDHFYGHAAVSEKITKRVLKRLKFDNDTLLKVSRLVYYHDYPIEADPKSVRRAVHKIGEDIFPFLFEIKKADILAQSGYKRQEKLEKLIKVQKIYEETVNAGECLSLRSLAVTGADVIEAGIKPGKEVGEILNYLLELVLENPERNTRQELIRCIYEYGRIQK